MLVFNAYLFTVFRMGKMQYEMEEAVKSDRCAILFELANSRYRSK